MKKIVGLVALAALAAPAFGQFRLDLTLTAREVNGSGEVIDLQTGGQINATVGSTYRVELRYRINDGTADTIGSRGLSAAEIRFNRSGTGAGAQTSSYLTFHQFDFNTIQNPDASTISTEGDGPATGLIAAFRGGLVANTDAANAGGGALGNTWIVTPLAISAPGHNSWASGPNPSAANTNTSTTVWALYSFDFTYGGGEVNFSASANADPQTGNRFGFFTRTGGTNNPVPVTSQLATDGTISFVPAPGAAALLGLGGLIAARRRRA